MAFNPQYTTVGERRRARKKEEYERARQETIDTERQQLFELEMKTNRINAEIAERKKQKLSAYDDLRGIIKDVEDFRAREFGDAMTDSDKMRLARELSDKYQTPDMRQRFLQGITDPSALYDELDAADVDLVREGWRKPKDIQERKLRVTKDGKVARISRGSSMYAGELEDYEIDAIELLGKDAYGSQEFNDLIKRLANIDISKEEADVEDVQARAALNKANADKIDAALKNRAGVTAETLTPGEKDTDKAFAPEYVEWARGGMADVEKNLSQLVDVNRALASGDNLTGGYIGLTPDKLLGYINPEALNNKEMVQEVVQRNLRLILGAQFTEKEGERLINRAYNDALSEEVNQARVGRLVVQIYSAAVAMDEMSKYYEENGTLKGYKGKRLTMSGLHNTWQAEAGKPPEIGDEYMGMIFIGGNPKDKASWAPR